MNDQEPDPKLNDLLIYWQMEKVLSYHYDEDARKDCWRDFSEERKLEIMWKRTDIGKMPIAEAWPIAEQYVDCSKVSQETHDRYFGPTHTFGKYEFRLSGPGEWREAGQPEWKPIEAWPHQAEPLVVPNEVIESFKQRQRDITEGLDRPVKEPEAAPQIEMDEPEV